MYGIVSRVSGKGLTVNFFEHNNEVLGAINGIFNHLRDYELLNKDPAPRANLQVFVSNGGNVVTVVQFCYFTPAGKITRVKITSNSIAFRLDILKTTDQPPYLRRKRFIDERERTIKTVTNKRAGKLM